LREDEILAEIDFDTIDTKDSFVYVSTFKVYQNTTFDDLKTAACDFWEILHPDKMVLTDEWFNVLTTYRDTIQNFFCEDSKY